MATLVFVCWGNICRSPMAERVARSYVAKEGLDVAVESFGISSEEEGNPIDYRAVSALTAAGYNAQRHRARRITRADIEAADLVVAAEPMHVRRLQALAPAATNIALLNDFNPAKPAGEPLRDPWYGDRAGFDETLADIEAAMPHILDTLR